MTCSLRAPHRGWLSRSRQLALAARRGAPLGLRRNRRAGSEPIASPVDEARSPHFSAAWNRHDVDALMRFMHDDCVFEAAGGNDACGTRHVGRDAVRRAFAAAWAERARRAVAQRPPRRARRFRRLAMDLHRHRRRRHAHRDRRRRPLHLQGRQDPGQERVPQGTAEPAARAASGRRWTSIDSACSIARRPHAAQRYDPRYDPLVDATPGIGRAYAPTLLGRDRRRAAGRRRRRSPATSMSTSPSSARARPASRPRSISPRSTASAPSVLEANQVSWGCSSRSGGQGQNASGRLKRSQWIERWGLDAARRLDAEIRAGFENFTTLTTRDRLRRRSTAAISMSPIGPSACRPRRARPR